MYGQFFISYKDEIRDNLIEMARKFNRDANIISGTGEKGNESKFRMNHADETYNRFCGYRDALEDMFGIFVDPVTAANEPYYSEIDKKTYLPSSYFILKSLKIDWNHKDPGDAPHDIETVSI